MSRMIEVSENEYIALMAMRELKKGLFNEGEVVIPKLKKIEDKAEELKKEFDELRRYETFMNNHPTHEIEIKSYSEGKASSFKANISKANMKNIATFLMEQNLAEQKEANEQIASYKGARKCQC